MHRPGRFICVFILAVAVAACTQTGPRPTQTTRFDYQRQVGVVTLRGNNLCLHVLSPVPQPGAAVSVVVFNGEEKIIDADARVFLGAATDPSAGPMQRSSDAV